MTAREKVEHFLKHDRTLIGGRNLYNQLPGKSLALQNAFARMFDNAQNLDKVCYELAQLVALPERNLKILVQRPVEVLAQDQSKENAKQPTKDQVKATKATPEDKLLAFDANTSDYNDAKSLLTDLDIKTKNKKKPTIFDALTEARTKLVTSMLQDLPLEIKASVKLRDQFPFLRAKDCPDVLKVLVNDLISAYERFRENQPKLHDLMGEDEAKALVKTVKDDYISNKQAFEELEHYKNTKEILGKHPIFAVIETKDKLKELSTADLTREMHNITTNRNRNKTKNNAEKHAYYEDLLAFATEELGKR